MKKLITSILISVLVSAVFSQEQPVKIIQQDSLITDKEFESIKLPEWKLHFGLFTIPSLNMAQKIKLTIMSKQEKINKMKAEIVKVENEIAVLVEELNKAKHNKSMFLLGLYASESFEKGSKKIYDEKSILWGLIKWGKKKNQNENKNNENRKDQ
ncbi:hypothetical protein ACFL4T_09885 [candidate division KSB1 bacterium]